MHNFQKNIICPSCSSSEVLFKGDIPPSASFAGRALNHELGGGALYGCQKCHLFFRYPRRSAEELKTLYRLGNQQNWAEAASQRADWELIRKWMIAVEGIKRVFDVGCFDGRFLEYIGRNYQWIGVEISEKAAVRARARGVQIVGNDFSHLSEINPLADVATAIDTIEHSISPRRFLSAMADCVRPGGYIVITTGNTAAPTWRLMGSRYWYCHIAEHMSFINPSWAKYVSPDIGLKVKHIRQYSHSDNNAALKQKIIETFNNLLLKFTPKLFAYLRKKGLGRIDLGRFPGQAFAPPSWMSAKDHILIIFQKSSGRESSVLPN